MLKDIAEELQKLPRLNPSAASWILTVKRRLGLRLALEEVLAEGLESLSYIGRHPAPRQRLVLDGEALLGGLEELL